MEDTALFDKATELIEIRNEKTKLEFGLDEVRKKKKQVEGELLQMMDQRDLKSFKHKKFGNIIASERIYGKIIDFDKVYEFFEEQGLDKVIFKLKPEKGIINKFVREWQDEGKTLPEGLDFAITRYIGVRKK